ncbi:MAG: 3-dehydroquinate synthase [Bryobacterales bacterium]|nr:3-dehydroquinate synthase [Bryobacterales bacterium]
MAEFIVRTAGGEYAAVVERGVLAHAANWIPAQAGKLFVITTEDVWQAHGTSLDAALGSKDRQVLFFPGGEANKRLSQVESLCDAMLTGGADRSSIVLAFGGGIVGDVGGFVAASFMRGVKVLQIPTTLLAQVDAATGGKTGVNLSGGKNLVGAFHQPHAVLADPAVLATLPQREYVAGLYEVLKYGVIRTPWLFELMESKREAVLAREPETVDALIAESVRIKAEVVSADERESGLRRILNFGHTIGHALEAETRYTRFLHGEAVGFGMVAATLLAERIGLLGGVEAGRVVETINSYGPIPSLAGVTAASLCERLFQDKKTIQGKVHFVLPERIGAVVVKSGIDSRVVLEATQAALARTQQAPERAQLV